MKLPIRILCVCQMGLGSSVMLKLNIQKAVKELGVDATVDSCNASLAKGLMDGVDLIITNSDVAPVVREYGKPIIELVNMVSKKELAEKLGEYVKNNS
ncbi:PTS sugar transporter subunit IIB [Anaerofustis stercorihominis]|uniref:PTS sugar transporter subunit IIB n=1 Tax=Anaerofustis stercorihominis TaxID=214853 RepID=UPI00214B75D7|nr:PTS sugar transporter subunit IIB [Anaerofustis stercorihominis]MCR2032867.1 PTS sugar transporter subunit IIB [Anaerofustis stercorihominis]